MMERTMFADINISLVPVLFLCGIVGVWAPACSSTSQVQQQQEQQTAETDSTAQSDAASDEDEEERVRALKVKYREQLRDDYRAEANEITTLYLLAQRRLYQGDLKNALNIVNTALEIRDNAELYALKGSIHLGLNNIDQFKKNWRTALKMDKNVPLPLNDYITEQLKEHGLLNENLERNF